MMDSLKIKTFLSFSKNHSTEAQAMKVLIAVQLRNSHVPKPNAWPRDHMGQWKNGSHTQRSHGTAGNGHLDAGETQKVLLSRVLEIFKRSQQSWMKPPSGATSQNSRCLLHSWGATPLLIHPKNLNRGL